MRRLWLIPLQIAVAIAPCLGLWLQTRADSSLEGPALSARPRVTHTEEAPYPDGAERTHENGKCAVRLTVDAEGKPRGIRILRCTDMIFAPNSLFAVERYQFKPGRDMQGNAVAVPVTFEIGFGIETGKPIPIRVRYAFGSPPAVTSTEPDANGIYPYTKIISPPAMEKYQDKGYSDVAFLREGKSPCDVVLTIDSQGRPHDALALHCENPELEKVAIASLLNSRYRPGLLKEQPVSVRAKIHLEYAE